MKRFFLAVLVSFVASSAFGWSDAGHKIIASIAYRQTPPEQIEKIVAILKHHPRFDEDFKSKLPDEITNEKEQYEFYFQQASIWPDIARGFRGDDKKYHHPTWHYINVPSFLTPDDKAAMESTVKVNVSLDPPATQQEDVNAIQTLRFARKQLADKSVPDDQKALLICWLFHVTGDIHQPLHSSALFSQKLFPTGDRGGNSIKTRQHGNLHSLWDNFLGGKIVYRTARNRAIALVNDPSKVKVGVTAAKQLDEKTWMDESHKLCEEFAYDTELTGNLRGHLTETEAPAIQLTERYLKAGGNLSEQRVVEAGYRLGAVLQQIANAN